MEISIKWNICRVCLQEEYKVKGNSSSKDIHFVDLFNEYKKLPSLIYELSGITMKPGDSLPDKICNKCVSIVNNVVQFRRTCLSSNSYLQSILEKTISASNLLKPEMSTREIESDYEGEVESQPWPVENKLEAKIGKQDENVTVTEETHTLCNILNDEIDGHNDNVSDYSVELEEIIEMSEEDQLYTEKMVADEDDLSSKSENMKQFIKDKSSLKRESSEISQLQKFYTNACFSKQKSSAEEEEYNCTANENDFLESGKASVYSNNSDKYIDEEGDVEFVVFDEDEKTESEIDESTVSDLDEQINNENQAQVSSTVDSIEKMEYYENNSNSNKHGLVDGSLSSRKVNEKSNKAVLHSYCSLERNKSPVVFSKPKIKRNLYKAVPYEPVQEYVCKICGNRYTNPNQLKNHMKIHLQYKNHQCELCAKRFITACNLQAHMRIHTGEKPFECKYCGRRFNDRSSHIRHERTHTNEKPYECVNCRKTFSLATTLQTHMKVHSDERSYRCEPCGKSFKLPHHLKKHENTTLHRSVLQIEDDEF